jgi:nucleoside-diphosphate-sugar epimerase
VKKLEIICNKKLEVKYAEATENDPKQRKPDIQKAKILLDWEPKISFDDGILNTINYFSKIQHV